jgi:hypothetical protein
VHLVLLELPRVLVAIYVPVNANTVERVIQPLALKKRVTTGQF